MSDPLPEDMACAEIDGSGGPEVLKPARRPLPEPSAGEVLIRVAAAGVNRPDVIQRLGLYPAPPGASDLPGLEVSGTVVATATESGRWRVGDQVCALVAGGGYAEYCTAPDPQCLPVPEGLDLVQAAALPETFFTVWSNLFDRAGLQAGESLLVHGGTSGIGTTAIQMAHHLGARVFATAGSDDKCRVCRDLGAEIAVNYRESDFVEAVRGATDGKGANVVLDMIGGDYVRRNIRALAPDGRLVFIAFMQGSKVEVDMMPVMLKRLTVTGSTLRARDVAFKGAIAAELESTVWPLLASGAIRPVIDRTFPLAEAAAAHRLMESSEHIGKIVLVP